MSKLVSGLLFGFALVALGQAFHLPRKEEILIVDVDAGADDATALLTLLGMEAKNKSPYKIEAITTVNGNTPITNVIPNVLKTLKVIDRLDVGQDGNYSEIKIYEGAHASLLGESIADNFFGEDGFGDFEYPDPPKPQDYLQPGSAADAMIDLVHKNPGGELIILRSTFDWTLSKSLSLVWEAKASHAGAAVIGQVTILCLGPLTNLALAINLNNTFFENVKEVIIMGGSVRGVGNISPGVEFNARVDPEANKIVLSSEPRPKIIIVPWEAALGLQVDMEWRTKVLGGLNSVSVDLLNKAEAVAIKKSGDVWISADSVAAVVLIQPEAAEDIDHDLVLAETQGEYGRGAFFVKYTANVGTPANAYIVQKVNLEIYKNVLLEYLG